MNAQVATTWAERAQAELGASRRFRELHIRLQRNQTHPQILQRVEQAEADEDRHAFWCSKMALKLGHTTGFAEPQGINHEKRPSWLGLPERDRLLLDVVLMGCITESLNASLLNVIYANAKKGEAADLLHRILKDEVKHGQIGWGYLHQECQNRDCTYVADYLVEMMELSVNDALFLPTLEPLNADSYGFGVMPHRDRLTQFTATLNEVICPGFEHFGIDASHLRAWSTAKTNAASS